MGDGKQQKRLVKPTEVRIAQLKENPPVIVDVRSCEEYAAGHVEGALHVPLDELPERLSELSTEQPVVTYCMMQHPGSSRGERAAALLREHGYAAHTLEGGLPAWEAAGMPVATGTDAGTEES